MSSFANHGANSKCSDHVERQDLPHAGQLPNDLRQSGEVYVETLFQIAKNVVFRLCQTKCSRRL